MGKESGKRREPTGLVSAGKGRRIQARTVRPDGLTDAKRQTFLDMLATTANVRQSCAEAGLAPTSAYRARLRDTQFSALWDDAIKVGYSRLEALLIERAERGPDRNLLSPDAALPDVETLDPELALHLLRMREASLKGAFSKGPPLKRATSRELKEAILAKLEILNQRLNKRNGQG